MKLINAKIGPFRSINTVQSIPIDEKITVFVGMNEAGKTVVLKALEKSDDVLGLASFDIVPDYPRKDLTTYQKTHATNPANATILTYRLTAQEVALINGELHTNLKDGFEFSITHTYKNEISIVLSVDEKSVIDSLIATKELSSDARTALKKAASLRGFPDVLKDVAITDTDTAFLTAIKARIAKTKWENVVQYEVWLWLKARVPKFLYFSDYDLLPSQVNLADLKRRHEEAKTEPKHLAPSHRAVLALLRMADISLEDFTAPSGYEPLKAKLEAVSISLTDQVMAFWKQNEDLEVEVDIKNDPADDAPFNDGPNLYLRIKNRRHRGVSTPFQHRSRGFIWFFSFLVWFDSVQHQLETASNSSRDLILLLDEPGLALHALAQADFLRYIDELSTRHQVLYSTHSPFMVHSDRLNQVRLVEDQKTVGTVVSDIDNNTDPRTIFPLQAALGWTIAQNLFISTRNLLVEGPSELIYLQIVSSALEQAGRTGLRSDVTIIPVGGLGNVATFVSLLGANELQLAVLHDYAGAPDQKLADMARQKLISLKNILNASQFRELKKLGENGPSSDIEDLFDLGFYLDQFSKTFSAKLGKAVPAEADLPSGDRVVDRLERWIKTNTIELRPSGGFNHYSVASHLLSNPPKAIPADTLDRFEALFKAVNQLYS